MADRYWVGGSATWDATAGTKWSTTSGGAGGASVPNGNDNVFFDQAGSYTVTFGTGYTASCANFTSTSTAVTFAGSPAVFTVNGSFSVAGTTIWSSNVAVTFAGLVNPTNTVTTNGVSIGGNSGIILNDSGLNGSITLGSALTLSGPVTITRGTFNTANYNVTATQIVSSNSNTRTINLGSSTVTLSAANPVSFTTSTNLTFNAGTSSIVCSVVNLSFSGIGLTFYDVSFTGSSQTSITIGGPSTFHNITVSGKTSTGLKSVIFQSDLTINGTLTLSAGADATCRTFVRSDTLGTTRTLTCAAFSGTDVDFRDITIAGAAAPVSGTRLGDCKGNSGITFGAGVNKYWNLAAGGNWSATGWATTGGGTPAVNNFPLAQDTCIFQSTGLNSAATVTVDASYNIGTIDMSARTANTMTLATGSTAPSIYGNWINGTGTTLTGTGNMTFAGRGSQTITSAGKTFTQQITTDSPSGSVKLLDAFSCNRNTASALRLNQGTFDANGYNVTLSAASSGVSLSNPNVKTVAVGSGTWTIAGSGSFVWDASTSTNLTITGTGTISLTSASAKTFASVGLSYTNITLDNGGAGALTITGNNTFKNITNSYSATGATTITFTSGTTTTLSQFTATGASGKVLTINTTTTSQATLTKPSTWYMGANSTDGGNNTGLTFTAGGGIDYLSVSYIKGIVSSTANTSNFFIFM